MTVLASKLFWHEIENAGVSYKPYELIPSPKPGNIFPNTLAHG
jgi:hypothetical protein